jgi:peptidoglycan hydrolase CwlO-like protein
MKQRAWMLILAGMISPSVYADGATDMIPKLKDIERIAAEQEAAIKTQSKALAKSQKEKEAAKKAAAQASKQQKAMKAAEAPAPVAATSTPAAAKPIKKVTAKPAPSPKVDPWLAQERRYAFP